MKIKVKFQAMSILMTELKETQMWAIYQMGTGDEMPVSVTKNDLTCIIAFLLKKLDWVDNGKCSNERNSPATVEQEQDLNKNQTKEQNSSNSFWQEDDIIINDNKMDLRGQWNDPDVDNRETSDMLIQTVQAKQDVNFDSQSSENQSSTNCDFISEIIEDALKSQTNEQNSSTFCQEDDMETIDNRMDLGEQQNGPDVNNCKTSDNLSQAVQDVAYDPQISGNKSITTCNFSLEETEDNEVLINQTNEQNHSNSVSREDNETNGNEMGLNKEFVAAHHLLRHEQEVEKHKKNSTEKVFSCSKCDKKFAKQYALHVHERIHTGIKPFACSYCDYKFTTSSDLKKHQRTHTGDKPYSCSQCEKKFSLLHNLKTHERIHTGDKPFTCSQCDYKCTTLDHLKTHQRIHTGDKPFCCSQCDYKCSSSSNLKKHERTHTGELKKPYEKPYSCSQCGKKFSLSHHLKQHERIHNRP